MNDQPHTLRGSIAAGFCGAAALTGVHELVRRVVDVAPRMDVLGERAITRSLEAAGSTAPPEPILHRWAMAGDLVANSLYYSLVALGSPLHVWRRGVGLGLAAGAGALVLPRPMGLGDPPKSDRLANQIMTVAWYLIGGVVAAAVASAGARSGRRRSHSGSRQPVHPELRRAR